MRREKNKSEAKGKERSDETDLQAESRKNAMELTLSILDSELFAKS